MVQPLSFEQKEALSWLKLLGVALLVISMFIALIYFTTKNDEMMDKQAFWEASLTTEQIAHIKQKQAEFVLADKGTLFSVGTKNNHFIGRVTVLQDDRVLFVTRDTQSVPHTGFFNEKFFSAVTEVAYTDTKEHEILSAEFAMQQ